MYVFLVAEYKNDVKKTIGWTYLLLNRKQPFKYDING